MSPLFILCRSFPVGYTVAAVREVTKTLSEDAEKNEKVPETASERGVAKVRLTLFNAWRECQILLCLIFPLFVRSI